MNAPGTILPRHPAVSRHADNPKWATIEAMTRAVMASQAEAFGFSAAEVDWLTRSATDAFFDQPAAERPRLPAVADEGRIAQ